jgi:hypothetical protein
MDRGTFTDRIFQIIVSALGHFQPRVLVNGVEFIALPPGRDLPQMPDVVADRRRQKIAAAYPGADHDPGVRKLPDRFHIEVKQARKALPGYAFGHGLRFRDLFSVSARSSLRAPLLSRT